MEQQIKEHPSDEGRPVPPHRSGGGRRIAIVGGGGTRSLALAAASLMAVSFPAVQVRREADWRGDRQEPINTGRRAEKDAAALAKAEAKRQRKMAKRAKAVTPSFEDLEQAAFEKWLHDTCPSGDVECVHRQWLESHAYAEVLDEQDPVNQCECHHCINEQGLLGPSGLLPLSCEQMILCPVCGNKRCPHANDHRNACTGSNEPGQPGSYYPGVIDS